MPKRSSAAPATPRRAFLRVLALAPAAAATGCATTAPTRAATPAPPPSATPAEAQAAEALAALRSFALSSDAEPVLVFRAATVRPGA
jgi:hypothetical protein